VVKPGIRRKDDARRSFWKSLLANTPPRKAVKSSRSLRARRSMRVQVSLKFRTFQKPLPCGQPTGQWPPEHVSEAIQHRTFDRTLWFKRARVAHLVDSCGPPTPPSGFGLPPRSLPIGSSLVGYPPRLSALAGAHLVGNRHYFRPCAWLGRSDETRDGMGGQAGKMGSHRCASVVVGHHAHRA
jgi:hypothetical protein